MKVPGRQRKARFVVEAHSKNMQLQTAAAAAGQIQKKQFCLLPNYVGACYFSSHSYYSVCHFVFMSCTTCHEVRIKI